MSRLALVSSVFAIAAIAACSNSNSGTPDAKKAVDAPPPTVMTVTCPATPDATVTTGVADAYVQPATTITQGQVVKFVMNAAHNVAPNTTMSDSGLNVGFGATACLMFTHTGTFGFHCSAHGFMGTVTVN
jgi:plastocyanin